MIHFCTLLLRFLECQILTFVYLWISHIKKFARKIAKIEATLLTQRLVPKGWNDPALTRTEPLTAGLGTGKDLLFESITAGLGAGKDLLFESILGRCVSSNEKLKVKNGYYVKIWWGAHIPICTNGPAIILSGMDLFATWWNWRFSLQGKKTKYLKSLPLYNFPTYALQNYGHTI